MKKQQIIVFVLLLIGAAVAIFQALKPDPTLLRFEAKGVRRAGLWVWRYG